jgi:STELLO glycosyltransferases
MTTAIVMTSINAPNVAMHLLADGAKAHGFEFIVCGDTKSPRDFRLSGCRFLSVEDQVTTGLRFAAACPVCTYARKNIGYLLAISNGANLILETDDDNLPRPAFFNTRHRRLAVPSATGTGWLNVYRYFSEVNIWPRGLPLDAVQRVTPSFEQLIMQEIDCPIQQGLADENPDVDAIYRLLLPLPQNFRRDRRVALGSGAWCPFNSQNTAWWSDVFPLLYLPVHCSFRMTDIWRSFVAQRIGWENGWHVLFHEPTMWQERNEHNLMRDFADEVPGYLHNDRIARALEDTSLAGGVGNLTRDLRKCYETLIAIDVVGSGEIALIEAWITDLDRIAERRHA